MKISLLIFLLGLLLVACSSKNNEQALRQLFDSTKFDTTIKRDLPFYDSIKELAIANIDTLFKFRNSRNIIDYYNENGKSIKQQRDEIMYSFFYSATTREFIDNSNSSVLPDFLVPKFRDAFERAGGKIGDFTLWNDSTVEFGISGFYDDKTNADVGHELVWKRDIWYEPQSLMKDTAIAPGWTYYIGVDERKGR
jgi:hypothetical protein